MLYSNNWTIDPFFDQLFERRLRRRQHVHEERPSEHHAEQQRVSSHPGQGRVRGHHGVRHGRQVLQREG